MTLKEILKTLDLMPFEEYRRCPKRLAWIAEMQPHHPGEYLSYRATVKTTSMICDLLVHLSNMPEDRPTTEKVYIRGHCPSYTRTLCEMARGYADRLGLDPMTIQPYYRQPSISHRGHPNLNIFDDHYYHYCL